MRDDEISLTRRLTRVIDGMFGELVTGNPTFDGRDITAALDRLAELGDMLRSERARQRAAPKRPPQHDPLVERWFRACLEAGRLEPFLAAGEASIPGWPPVVETLLLWGSFQIFHHDQGERCSTTPEAWGVSLRRLLPPEFEKRRRRHNANRQTGREYIYLLPPLDRCRAHFARVTNMLMGAFRAS